ncbi:MAG: flagellar motor protein MotB [Bdellovibrionia bacterium]
MAKFKTNRNLNEDPAKEQPKSESSHSTQPHDESNWLISYADMMTLLCGFFIMLFSMAKMDSAKYDGFKKELSKQFKADYVPSNVEMQKVAAELKKELAQHHEASVTVDFNGIAIVFQSTVFFDTLSAEVTHQGKIILEQLIESIAQKQKTAQRTYKIIVEGHTDSRPIMGGVYPSNWELSGARASRVVRMFLAKGFTPHQLTAIGYADTYPKLEVTAPTPSSQASHASDPSKMPQAQALDPELKKTSQSKTSSSEAPPKDPQSSDPQTNRKLATTPLLQSFDSPTTQEAQLAQNRRVVLRILDPEVDAIPFPESAATHEPSLPTPKEPKPLASPLPSSPAPQK